MTVIKKAIVKSYDAATHKAAVQIAGSLGVWLEGIRVATDIPAADVIAGRQCSVLFLDPSNQDEALVLTIQGAAPSVPSGATVAASATVVSETAFGQAAAAGAATPYSRGDHTHGTPTDPVPAHAAAADPHTVYGALAQAETWTLLQTFNAGIKIAGGDLELPTGGLIYQGGLTRILLGGASAEMRFGDDFGVARLDIFGASPHVRVIGDGRFGVAEKVLIGEVPGTSAADDDGIRLNATGSIPSALLTFVSGELLELGINIPTVGLYQSGRPGMAFRIDSRVGIRTYKLRGYDGSTFVDMFQIPMHPNLSGGASDDDFFARSTGCIFTIRGGTGAQAAIADVQAVTANRQTALRVMPKGSPGGERSLFTFYSMDVIADPTNVSLLRIVANATPEIIFRSQKAGTGTQMPMIFDVDDGSTITEAFRVEIDAGVKFANTEIGFFGAAPIVKPTVTGSRAGNAALASLLTQLANLGLLTDSSTA